MLPILNYDYLYAAQDHSIFMKSHTFMMEQLAVPGGFLKWAGCYFTQFFYYPCLGSGILIAIWIASYIISLYTFDIKRAWTSVALIPIIALLCSVIDLGYWIYYLKNLGYWFSESLGYLTMMIALMVFKQIITIHNPQNPQNHSLPISNKILTNTLPSLFILLWGIFGYILFGWWGLLGLILMGCMCFHQRPTTNDQPIIRLSDHPIIRLSPICLVVITLISVPWIAYYCYTSFRIEDAWTIGFPLFQHLTHTDWNLSIPFFFIIATTILVAILSHTNLFRSQSKVQAYSVTTIVALLSITAVVKANITDKNFHSELRLYRQIEECRWQDAIDEFKCHQDHPTHQMVMCKNIALINLHQLGEQMFSLNNIGTKPNSGELQIRMTSTAGPLLYYYNGLVNYAYRWAIENEVDHGLSVKLLKMMIRCAIWNQEYQLASKYITMMRSTTFHKQWARNQERMIYDLSAFIGSKEYQAVAPLEIAGSGELDADNGLCEEYIIYNYACLLAQNPVQQEAAVCYAMMIKDDDLIKFQLENYYSTHPIQDVPKHIVEAVDIYNQQHSPQYQKFIADYQRFLGNGARIVDVGKSMKPIYNKTYWWYYYFFNDFNIY